MLKALTEAAKQTSRSVGAEGEQGGSSLVEKPGRREPHTRSQVLDCVSASERATASTVLRQVISKNRFCAFKYFSQTTSSF